MTEPTSWHQSNSRQLAAEMESLRQRLESFIKHPPETPRKIPTSIPRDIASTKSESSSTPDAAKSKTVGRSFIERLLGKTTVPKETSDAAAPPDGASAKPSDTTFIEKARPPMELASALDILCEKLGLSGFERNVLLLCAAMELDTRIAGLCAKAQDDPHKPFPTFALALTLFEDASWDVLSPERPLRYWRLVEINQPGGLPLTSSALRADERIVNYIKGLNYLDDRLFPLLVPLDLDSGSATLARSQAQAVETILHRWKTVTEPGPLPVVQLVGPDPISKQLVAQACAAQLNRRIYRLPAELLPNTPTELEILARLWQREGRLFPVALYMEAEEIDRQAAELSGSLGRFLGRCDGVIFLGVSEVMPRQSRTPIVVDVAKPTAVEQQAAWVELLGESGKTSAPVLASQFNLNLVTINKLSRMAQTTTDSPEALSKTIWQVCCESERPRMDALAQRLEPKMSWDDLVLPAAQISLLKQIAAQVAYRNTVYQEWGFARKMSYGFSISALFAGDSGTGKTMAAEVIANALRLNLYRIDLSAVVNKYIGETEKNLRRLFDAAENGGAILFFDEADALFGKRSEVRDSHDRYANIETNYLLQRIESYCGLAILATNMKTALDPAFLRRLRFVVEFPYPCVADRRRIWERVFLQPDAESQPAPPVDRLDYDRLARLNLSPGHIHNIALNAAFMAANSNSKITMPLILDAARIEFLKLGRPLNEADFRWTQPTVIDSNPVHSESPVPEDAKVVFA